MSKSKSYEIPLHKCQICYHHTGRFILDCYCVLCQHCYKPSTEPICCYCQKPTNNRKLDTKDEGTYEKVGMMFGRPQIAFSRGIEILKFQTNIANRYAEYLESELKVYKNAVYDLVRSNPRLDKYFSDRIRGFRVPPKSTNPGQRSKSDVTDAHRSKKSVTIVQARKPQEESRKPQVYERDKPRDKERVRVDREKQRLDRDKDRDRDDRRPSPPPGQQHPRHNHSKQQSQFVIQSKGQQQKLKHDTDQTNKESFYNWQDRMPKQYYSREEEKKARNYNDYDEHRVHSKSRSGSDMPSSSYMCKKSDPRDFLQNGFRRRI